MRHTLERAHDRLGGGDLGDLGDLGMHARFGRCFLGDEPILASLRDCECEWLSERHKTLARQFSFNIDACRCLLRCVPKDALSTGLARVRERTCSLETRGTPTPRAHRRAESRSPLLRAVQSRSAARRGRIGLNDPLGGGLRLCE